MPCFTTLTSFFTPDYHYHSCVCRQPPPSAANRLRARQSLPLADRLSAVDGTPITPADRVAIVAQTHKLSRAELVAFHVNLALLCAASPVLGRDYNVRTVLTRRHVVAAQMEQLYGLAGLRLSVDDLRVAAKCDLREFTRLRRLDLSGNALDGIGALGLDALPLLQWLDLRDNAIATPHAELAAHLDALPALEVVALRGNPCVRADSAGAKDRLAIMGHMRRLRAVTCTLRVMDTEITVNERVAAWQVACRGV